MSADRDSTCEGLGGRRIRRRRTRWFAVTLAAGAAIVTGPIDAATITNPALLPGGDGGAGDRFGTALALDGDTLIVGVPQDNHAGSNSGSVYVFTRVGGTWTEQQRLVPADSSSGIQFGFAVALHEDTLIVGAPYAGDADEGAAYVFERNAGQFEFQRKFEVTPMAQPRYFGWSVAAGPDVVWIGSPAHFVAGAFQGSATEFERDNSKQWTERATFGPFGGTGGEQFGIAMAYADGYLIVGESGERVGTQDFAGAAIAYRYDGTLTELGVLSVPNALSFDRFGAAIAIDGQRAVIGAPSNQRPGYVQPFRRNGSTWVPDGPALSSGALRFGHALAIDGERIAVSELTGNGRVRIRERVDGQWISLDLIEPPDLADGDDFGTAVAFDGSEVLVGVPGRDAETVADVGEVRTFVAAPEVMHRDGFEQGE